MTQPPTPGRRTFRPDLSQVPGTDVGQPGRKAEPEGPRLQVQGSRMWWRDLAAARIHCGGAERSIRNARGQRAAAAVRACGNGKRRCGSRGRGRQRDAPLPDLRRRDVGRPCLQAQSAGARLQVPEQAARARRSRVRGGDLAGARWLAEPISAADRTTLGALRDARRRHPGMARPSTTRRRRTTTTCPSRVRRRVGELVRCELVS